MPDKLTTAVRIARAAFFWGGGWAAIVAQRSKKQLAERTRRERTWRVPVIEIYDLNVAFSIDDVIRSATLHERWRSTEDAVRFARQTLEVAIINARIGATMKYKDLQSNWKTTAKLAEKAHNALDQLVRHLLPQSVHSSDLATVWRADLTFDRLVHNPDALSTTLDTLMKLSKYADARRSELAQTAKNHGDIPKRYFVFRLAEGWTFLTGKVPGRNYDASRNPFLRFVLAAWRDAGMETADEEDFSSALDSALKTFSNDYGGEQSLRDLVSSGPTWP